MKCTTYPVNFADMLINLVNRHLHKTKKLRNMQWWKPVIVAGNALFHIFILLTPLLRFSTSILNIMMGLPQIDQLFRVNRLKVGLSVL